MKLRIKQQTVSAKGQVVNPGQEIEADPVDWPVHRIKRLAQEGHLEVVSEEGETGGGEGGAEEEEEEDQGAQTHTMDQPTGMQRAVDQIGSALRGRKKRK